MKKIINILVLVFIMLLTFGCDKSKDIKILLESEEIEIKVNQEVDFKKYFEVYVANSKVVVVDEYLTSNVDITKPGDYEVTLTFENVSKTLKVKVINKQIEILLSEDEINVYVNSNFDYKKYFKVLIDEQEVNLENDKNVHFESNVDITKPGDYEVTLTFENVSKTLKVKVIEEEKYIEITDSIKVLNPGDEHKLEYKTNEENVEFSSNNEKVATVTSEGVVKALEIGTVTITITGSGSSSSITIEVKDVEKVDLSKAFNKLVDKKKWNFKLIFTTLIEEVSQVISDQYSYDGENIIYTYEYDGYNYVDYLITDNGVKYYYTSEDGKYVKYAEGTSNYKLLSQYITDIDFSKLLTYSVIKKGDVYYFENPKTVNDEILGEYESNYTVESVAIELNNDYVSKMTFTCKVFDEGTNKYYTYIDTIEIYDYDKVTIDVEKVKKLVQEEIIVTEGKKSVFLDQDLKVSSSSPEYTADKLANSYDNIRGVQFLQNVGTVKITSKKSYEDVKSITLVLATNQELGANVKVKVGSVYLKCDGQEEVTISKTNFNETVTVTFTANDLLDGVIEVELIPTSTKNSIYIKSIAFASTGSGSETNEYMEKQNYDSTTFNHNTLQDYIKESDDSIGLPCEGNINVLVVPVQFKEYKKYTNEQLQNINKAFNGTVEDTGWQSVKTYYQTSSFGKLNMTFDIVDPVDLSNSVSYYEKYSKQVILDDGTQDTKDGSMLILEEVLGKLDPEMDLTKYDNDNDKVIDGVYLIYNNEVDYDGDFYWAYVSWYSQPDEKTYDGLSAYYYLFASYYFVDEDTETGYKYEGIIKGLKLNSTTFIHETGHMLSMDDYYDYNKGEGSDRGLGGAAMMDNAYGDHDSYTKTIMGWVTPTIITETKTITIKDFESSGDVILVPLKFNNSYMSEYLLIDLYTNTGLNKLHGDMTYLYGLCQYGVRIYHISSDIEKPYNDSYGSFTTNNNSMSEYALIKLIEADGDTNFESSEGYASSTDLWLANTSLQNVFPKYTRNDGKLINFNIKINSVNINEASITIEYMN